MWRMSFNYNGRDYDAQGEPERTAVGFTWYQDWTIYGYGESGKITTTIRAKVISPETAFPEIIDRKQNGDRKRYFVRVDDCKYGYACYRLRYAYRDYLPGFIRITRKDAEKLMRIERARRKSSDIAGYADADIFSAYRDYLSIQ